MNRIGWIILMIIGVSGAAFAMLVDRSSKRSITPEAVVRAAPDVPLSGLAIPVVGVRRDQLADTWNDARGGGLRAHQAIDIMAPRGTPVVAVMAGRIEKLFESKAGGTTVYVRSGDGRWIAYYAHLAAYYPGIAEGQPVKRGQQLGFVGDTGNAGAGNNHLHFALQRMAQGERWWQGTPVNPYPLLAGKPSAR